MKRLLAALVLLVPFVVVPQAQASNSYSFDCLNPGVPAGGGLIITESAGATFTFNAPNCQIQGYDPNYITTSMFTSITATPPYMWIGPETFTMAGAAPVFLSIANPAIPGDVFTIDLRVASGGGGSSSGGSSSASADLPPAPVMQGLPLPASGDCADVKEQDALWAKDIKGGWQRGWERWTVGDGSVFEGWACIRTLEYREGTWVLR